MRWGHADSWMFRFWWGNSLRLGAPPPNHVSSSPSPSSLKQTLFAIFGPYGPSCFVAHTPNLLDVPASGRKETHASPIYFWWRRFGEPSRNSSRVAALADCWRFRSVVVGGSGDSSYLNPSEPNLQKANGRKYRKGKDYKANNTEAKIVRKKHKRSPKPDVEAGSVLGSNFYLIVVRGWFL